MKNRTKSAIISCILVICLAFVACARPPESGTSYTITFETFGGSVVESITARVGEKINEPTPPQKPQYEFDKWYQNEDCTMPYTFTTMGQKNIRLYAGWTAKTSYRITFDSMGGSAVDPITAIAGEQITPPTQPTKPNHTFMGWYKNQNFVTENKFTFGQMPAQNTTLFALWATNEDTKTLTLFGNGEEITKILVSVGSKFTPPLATELFPDYEEIEIDGWYTDADYTTKLSLLTAINQDLDLHFKYHSKNFTLSEGTATYNGTAKIVIVPNGVTELSNFAFSANKNLTTVILPSTLTKIGNFAFYNCTNLTSVGTLLSKNKLPANLTTIGNSAFFNCVNLKSIQIGANVTTISANAFSGCSRLGTVNLSQGLTTIQNSAFANTTALKSISIPSTVTTLGDYAFMNSGLNSFIITENISSYGSLVLDGCTNLQSLKIAEGNTYFINEDGAYYTQDYTKLVLFENTQLATYQINQNTTEISTFAFGTNNTLKHVILPANLVNARGALSKLNAIEELTINSFDHIKFLSYYFGAGSLTLSFKQDIFVPANLKTINLGENVTSIPEYAFYACNNITTYNGLEKIESVGDYAFAHNMGLTSFNVASTLTDIGYNVFYGATNITTFTVDSQNTKYAQVENCIYDTTQNRIIRGYINADQYDFSAFNSNTDIGEYALEGSKINKITLSNKIRHVYEGAFQGMEKIEHFTFTFEQLPDDELAPNGTINAKRQIFSYMFTGELWIYAADYMPQVDKVTLNSTSNMTALPIGAFSRSKIDEIELADSFTNISNEAFLQCTLKSFPKAKNIKRVGISAFFGSGLESLVLPSTLETIDICGFQASINLKTIDFSLASNLKHIKDSSFNGCISLEEIQIPKQLQTLEFASFLNCTSLKSITFEDGFNLTTLPDNVFAFTAITQIEIPKSVIEIGRKAFSNCGVLANVTFEEGSQLQAIGVEAFTGESTATAPKIRTITFPDSLISIGKSAFFYCASLESVSFGNSQVNDIGEAAFAYCTSLKDFQMPRTIISITSSTFEGCESLKTITIPSTVEKINSYAFYNCTGLEEVIFEGFTSGDNSKLSTIGEYAFASCVALRGISIPSSVVEIGSGALSSCTELKYIILGDGITDQNGKYVRNSRIGTIGSHAFSSPYVEYIIFNKTVTHYDKINESDYEYVPLFGIDQSYATTLDYLERIETKVYLPSDQTSFNFYMQSAVFANYEYLFTLDEFGI